MKIKTIFVILIIIHTLCILFIFPIGELLSPYPISTGDYGVHFYQNITATHFLSHFNRLWGYDPYFMAGYPMGVIFDIDNKFVECLVYPLSFLGEVFSYKLLVLMVFFALPFCIYKAALNFGLDQGKSLLCMGISILFWHLDSSMRWAWYCGMYTFSFVSYFSLFFLSYIHRYYKEQRISDLIPLFISGVIIFFTPFSPFILSLPLLVYVLCSLRSRKVKVVGVIGSLGIMVILLDSVWLVPLFRFFHYLSNPTHALVPTSKTLLEDLLSLSRFSPGTGFLRTLLIRNAIIFLGVYGIILWAKRKEGIKSVAFGLSALWFFSISYGSFMVEVAKNLQPYRFVLPMSFFLIIPAAEATLHLFKEVRKMLSRKLLPLGILLTILFLPLSYHNLKAFVFSPKIRARLSQDNKQLLKWIEENTSTEARLLFEDNWNREGFPVLINYFMKREIIGGPYIYTFLKHNFAEFFTELTPLGEEVTKLFNKPLEDYSLEKLKRYFEAYNIKWVFAYSETAKNVFNLYPSYLEKRATIGETDIYEVRRKPTYFIMGSGKVKAVYNRIELRDLSRGEIIIKYHFLETFKAKPEIRIEEVKVLDDPVGFIKIVNNKYEEIIISNAY